MPSGPSRVMNIKRTTRPQRTRVNTSPSDGTCEEVASKWQALPYVERHITDFMRLDVRNIGGFTEAIKVAGWCEAHYIDLMPHNPLGPVCTAASIHFAAAVPNFAWLEFNRGRFRLPPQIEIDLLQGRPVLDGAGFAVPTGRFAHQLVAVDIAPLPMRFGGSAIHPLARRPLRECLVADRGKAGWHHLRFFEIARPRDAAARCPAPGRHAARCQWQQPPSWCKRVYAPPVDLTACRFRRVLCPRDPGVAVRRAMACLLRPRHRKPRGWRSLALLGAAQRVPL